MAECWMGLRSSLVDAVGTAEAREHFREASARWPALLRFEDLPSFVAWLERRSDDHEEKDAVYRALVTMAQSRGAGAGLAVSLLWLGLWPKLDRIFRDLQWRFPHGWPRPGELASDIGVCFTAVVERADLARIRRLAATLMWNTWRDVRKQLHRRVHLEVQRADLLEDDLRWEQEALDLDPRDTRYREPSDLGVLPGMSEAAAVAVLRERLVEVVGDDADLAIGVAVYGQSQTEAGRRLGLKDEASRKRYQLVRRRLRALLFHAPVEAFPTSSRQGACRARKRRSAEERSARGRRRG